MGPETATLFVLGEWELQHYVVWAAVITAGYELLSWLVLNVPAAAGASLIPKRAPHLDDLEWKDIFCITFSRSITLVFVYHLLSYCHNSGAESGHVVWEHKDATVANTLGSLIVFFIVYDFAYTSFHIALHHPSVYWMVHKHHHRQKVPSRGNVDAVNVHPFEFTTGEYLHLAAIALVPCHIYAVAAFIIIGGFMASLNHTRFDLILPGGMYGVRYHDEHHVAFNYNFGQYIMLWDRVFGTFRDPSYSPPLVKKTE